MSTAASAVTASGTPPRPHAERLYYDSAILEFAATVTDIRQHSRQDGETLWQIALDRTAFYPEGGGQPWDTGMLEATARSGAVLEVPVERVEEDEAGEVWHFVRKPLMAGTEVMGFVNSARRTDHEQQHSGQHLLSAMFLRELGAGTVSFHLGAESSTIDLALRDGMGALTASDLERVEDAANRVALEARPMRIHWVQREYADEMLRRGDLRKIPEREGPFRIVQMQGIEFNACGGTHVAHTGEIGAVLLRKVEKVKQGWRVEFVCGGRAVRAARRDYAVLGQAAQALSVTAADVPQRVRTLLEDAKGAGKERKALLAELARAEASRLVREGDGEAVLTAVFAGRDVDFAKAVVSACVGDGHSAIAGVTMGAAGAVVMGRGRGSDVDCGAVLREVLAAQGARGGGSAEMAQGVCEAGQTPALVAALAGSFKRG